MDTLLENKLAYYNYLTNTGAGAREWSNVAG